MSLLLVGPARADSAKNPAPGSTQVSIQILNVSDFHGQLDPLDIFGVGAVGGAAALSSYWAADRAANPNTLLLTAGDAVGASPPLSSFFQDRPTIDWMNYAGFDADTLGNHNFDAGLARLQSQIDSAEFDYVSSNLKNVDENVSGVSPYQIYKVGKVKVAVIGVTNPEAPSLVTPGNFGTIEITDPVVAAMEARQQAREDGAKVFIAIGHLGIEGRDASGEPIGPLVDFAQSVSGFDLILGDHTDVEYSKTINDALVVENKSKGATYARTTLTYDRRNNQGVVDKSVEFVVPRVSAVTPDPQVAEMLQPYRAALAEQLDVPIGIANAVLPRGGTPAVERVGEVAIGNLTTDAMRATYGTQIAFTNGGGLRSPLPAPGYLPQDTSLRRTSPGYALGPPYDLVIGDIYTLLPFGNEALTRTVTGSQLWAALEHSVSSIPSANGKFLQISGFKFTYDAARAPGSRVVSVTLDDGTAIPNDALFTVTATTNNFTNAGGDGYTMLADGKGTTRDLLANVVVDYVKANPTVTSALQGRIIRLN
jgi:5'-nucleotidase